MSSCQKDLSPKDEVITAVVASDANSPLKSHSLTFSSNYPVNPGEVPPFSFTKIQYPDARVKSIRMLSRKNPIYPGFAKEAVELIGNFTYAANTGSDKDFAPHLAFLKGTSEVWEYYKTSTGAAARKSISKKNVDLKFYLLSTGYCTLIQDWALPGHPSILFIGYTAPQNQSIYVVEVGPTILFTNRDQYGNILSFQLSYNQSHSYFRINYDYSKPRGTKNFNFIPSQNLISQEFSLLEVMQWLPQSTHQRKSAGGIFEINGNWFSQDQVYKNYQFDANGNLFSLTYGDNILQKTTWHVQP